VIDATDQELVRMMVAAAASLETLHFGAAASVVRAGAGADDALLQRLPLLLGEVSFRCHDPPFGGG
jgi:hypothetical protein